MDFVDKIKEIGNRIPKQIDLIKTEEATKNAFVMPFINALGYDIFNPIEVVPEFTADVGTKKGEKVDYAIKKDNEVIMLIECKQCGNELDQETASQLYRYFSVTETRFGIITNGIVYKFFSDIEESNKMDTKPFFEFNVLNFEDHHLEELKKFAKSSFHLENILTTASALKYTGAIKRIFGKEIINPSDEFIKFFVSQVYSGLKTQAVISQFSKIVKDAISQFIREKINDRLKSALDDVGADDVSDVSEEASVPEDSDNEDGIVTTKEEIEGYNIVKAIVRDTVDVNRIFMRDTKSYCGILLDDNNRKPICRLRFNSATKKYIGIIKQKNETKNLISDVNDIFNYSDEIKESVLEYIEREVANAPEKEDNSMIS